MHTYTCVWITYVPITDIDISDTLIPQPTKMYTD